MFYVVTWRKGDVVVAETRFEYLGDAKVHAHDRFPIQKIRKGVTAVEVADDEGVVYYRFGEHSI